MKVVLVKQAKADTILRFALQSATGSIRDFKAKKKELAVRYEAERTCIYAGLGDPAQCSLDLLRSAAAAAVRQAQKLERSSLAIEAAPTLPGLDAAQQATAILEGALLANYAFDTYKSEKAKLLHGLELVDFPLSAAAVRDCQALCSAVCTARDLVNLNAGEVTPAGLAKRATTMAGRFPSLQCRVLTEKELRKEKLGLLLAVGQGSAQGPRLIIIEYKGGPASQKPLALVGKGITFDTGGHNLKPSGSIETMRNDMAGAAAVFGVMEALATSRLKANVIALIPAAHNALQSDAFFPGDVYRAYNGKTVEICNTDAEGRLVLADAIAYAQKQFKPRLVVDVATLTGSILASFGDLVAGLFSNDDQLAAALSASSQRSNEPLWRMPLLEAVNDTLKSDVADLRNLAKLTRGHAGAVAAAGFLQAFVEPGTPWAHLDIAGVAWNAREERGEVPKFGTGFGVRLLVDFIKNAGK